MKTLKFNYSGKEYIYTIKSYTVDFTKKLLTVEIVDSMDKLFNWIKNNKEGGAKEYVTDIVITDKEEEKVSEYLFNECRLYRLSLLADTEDYEITVSYKSLNIGIDK